MYSSSQLWGGGVCTPEPSISPYFTVHLDWFFQPPTYLVVYVHQSVLRRSCGVHTPELPVLLIWCCIYTRTCHAVYLVCVREVTVHSSGVHTPELDTPKLTVLLLGAHTPKLTMPFIWCPHTRACYAFVWCTYTRIDCAICLVSKHQSLLRHSSGVHTPQFTVRFIWCLYTRAWNAICLANED